MSEPSAFGRRLKTLREQAGLSQAKLAERSGINQYTIQSLELGRSKEPARKTVRELAKALGVSPSVFDQDLGEA